MQSRLLRCFAFTLLGCGAVDTGDSARPTWTGPPGTLENPDGRAAWERSGDNGGGGHGLADAQGTPGTSGLPCDVATLLANRCQSCHASTPLGGAPMPLVGYDDLTKRATSDPSKTVADRVVARMQSTTSPMPPEPAPSVPSAEVAAVRSWIDAGYPKGTCGPVCTSKTHWTGGNEASPQMHPGGACLTCHQSNEGPTFSIGGTLYPTAHEPLDCDGTGGANGKSPAQVFITDTQGHTTTLTANAVGNFYSSESIAFPFTAKVVYDGRERAMATPQSTGDCNSCHTENGAHNAPGRIMLP